MYNVQMNNSENFTTVVSVLDLFIKNTFFSTDGLLVTRQLIQTIYATVTMYNILDNNELKST